MENNNDKRVGSVALGTRMSLIGERPSHSLVSAPTLTDISSPDPGRGHYMEEAPTGTPKTISQATAVVAKKDDVGKADLAIIPEVALVEMSKAFTVGEKKYGRYNYLAGGFTICRITSAMIRHGYAYLRGEEYDPKDGQHHLGSVLACAAMLLDLRKRGKLIDDRYVEPVCLAGDDHDPK